MLLVSYCVFSTSRQKSIYMRCATCEKPREKDRRLGSAKARADLFPATRTGLVAVEDGGEAKLQRLERAEGTASRRTRTLIGWTQHP